METFLIKAAQLILAFAILVIIHEFGHFLFARIFGVKVEKFYIFFNPWTSIFKWRPGRYVGFFGKKKRLKGADEAETREKQEDEEEEKQICKAYEKARKICLERHPGKEPDDKELEKEAAALIKRIPEPTRGFWRDTEYGIGWLPLGGYCKIAGMIDESMDTEQLQKPPKHWEFRSKPAWQRLLVMVAGVLFNFLLAILIYAGIVYVTGEKFVPLKNARHGMVYSEASHKIGFQDGDIPLLADGDSLDIYPNEAQMQIMQAKKVTVVRNGQNVDINIPENFMFQLDNEAKDNPESFGMMTYAMPARITQVVTGEGADKAGIKVGDEIIRVNGKDTPTVFSFMETLKTMPGKNAMLTVVRPESTEPECINAARRDTLNLNVHLNSGAKIGVGLEVDPSKFYPSVEKKYNIFESVPRGIEMGTSMLTNYAKSMKQVFTKEGAQSLGGFGAIGSIFPEKWNWIAFWNIAAFLSVALAFMNILPIPALDGGHVLFLLYEVFTGRKPSEKFLEYAQMVGMILLILLLVYANGMDIVRLFK